jgi:hypothetical protein
MGKFHALPWRAGRATMVIASNSTSQEFILISLSIQPFQKQPWGSLLKNPLARRTNAAN